MSGTSAFSGTFGKQDVPYYDTPGDRTTYFFEDAGMIYSVPCPTGQVIHSRAECSIDKKIEVIKTADAIAYLGSHLNKVITAPKAIVPFSSDEVAILLSGGGQDVQALNTQVDAIKKEIAKHQEYIQTFGADVPTQQKLDEANTSLKNLQEQIQAARAYTNTRAIFDSLAASFVKFITSPDKITPLVALKSQGTFPDYFAQILTKNYIPRDCNIKSYGDLVVGSKVMIDGYRGVVANGFKKGDYSSDAKQYVGRVAIVQSIVGLDHQVNGCVTVMLDVDYGNYLWDIQRLSWVD